MLRKMKWLTASNFIAIFIDKFRIRNGYKIIRWNNRFQVNARRICESSNRYSQPMPSIAARKTLPRPYNTLFRMRLLKYDQPRFLT